MVAIADIVIGERYRKDLGDLATLAASIDSEGLLQPIAITEQNELVAGERRLRAVRDILKRPVIAAYVVNVSSIVAGEFAENIIRKDFTVTERCRLADAVRDRIGNRAGQRTDLRPPEKNAEVKPGTETRTHVAEVAGFGNDKTYRDARRIIREGSPELIGALDAGEVPISVAVELLDIAHEAQATVLKNGRLSVQGAAKEIRRRKAIDKERIAPRVRLTGLAFGTYPCTLPNCKRGPDHPFDNAGSLGNHRFAQHGIKSTNIESLERQARRDRNKAVAAAEKSGATKPTLSTRPDASGRRPGPLDRGDVEALRRGFVHFMTTWANQYRRYPKDVQAVIADLVADGADLSKPIGTARIGRVDPDASYATSGR